MSSSWQEELRQRLVERNVRESAYAGIIEQYRRLAQQTRLLKERNQSLLRAVNTVRGAPAGGVGASVSALQGDDNAAVRNAYIASLESQISSLRDEMAAVYKTQGQNAQRLLAMNETLREKEEVSRQGTEELRRTKEELATLKKKVDQHKELMAERDDRIQTLHDEIQTLELELSQTNERNQILKQDNASLLSRWLDRMNDEADKMNSANNFYEDMKNRGWSKEDDPKSNHTRSPSEDSETWSVPSGEDHFKHLRDPPSPAKPRRSPNG
ncbi:hypothetical protein FRC02_011516 [Tulasnella sp. 418]|nr:hypothetical protein FRC02_011516 [Tulasnella sp. 418]